MENIPVLEYFEHCVIVTGTVLQAEPFPEARKPAIKLLIDFGPMGLKKSSAQITSLYNPTDLVGRQIIALVNLPPRNIAGFVSECLVLGAVCKDGSVVLLTTERIVENGIKIS
ncbi:MAG: tRNA-binding protein [Bacteroidota bacterium]